MAALRPPTQRRATSGVVKENVSDFVAENVLGKEAKDRTIKKALVSKGEFEPKQKHVRKAILDSWKENGCNSFLRLLTMEPIDSDAICAFKGVVVTHKILHEGPSNCLQDCYRQIDLFNSLLRNWERRYREGYSEPLKLYLQFIVQKIQIHHKHPDFHGSFSLEEFLKRGRVPRYDQPNEVSELVSLLLAQQALILRIREEILRGMAHQVMPAKLSALIPLIAESYNLYSLVVYFLRRLCDVVDSLDAISHLTEPFYSQYFTIRAFYEDCSNIHYVTSLLTVPCLPPDPPQFLISRPKVSQPKRAPVVQEKKEKVVAPESSVNELERLFQPAPAPAPVAPPPTVVSEPTFPTYYPQNQMSFGSIPQYQSFQAQPQQYSMTPNMQGWVSFTNDSQMAQMGQFNPQQGNEDPFAFSRLQMEKAREEPVPAPAPAPAPAAPAEDPRDAQILDLKRRLLGLQKLFKIEKENRLKAEEQVKQLEEQITKWKGAYENLLKKNETLRNENGELSDRLDAQESRIEQIQQEREKERMDFLIQEIADVAKALELSLVRLDNPTAPGRVNATPEEVTDAVGVLLRAIESLVNAKDGPSRVAALRDIGTAASNLLDLIKGVANLTDNPQIKQMLFDAARGIARSIASLLSDFKSDPEDEASLLRGKGGVEGEVERLRGALHALLTDGESSDNTVDFDSFADEATRELMRAVQAIEDAARRLESAKAEKKAPSDPVAAGISEAIMDAALAIAQATANLVKNATTVQEENIRKGRASSAAGVKFYKRDCVWMEGLISAAKAVAAATSHLVQCASDAADGKVDEETLLAASQEVSAATAQLVYAARVRSDPNSEASKRLEDASKAVSSATHHLVEAARAARSRKEEAEDASHILEFQNPMKKMLAVQEAKTNILRLENQLSRAQKYLTELHAAEYK